jgi:tetratricopeptide (TPR) repeat protein
MARVDTLPEAAKEVLQTGSVIEREFSYELIKKVSDLAEPELLSHLSVLKDSELLYERGIFPQSVYIFKHALTQEVVYNSLLLKRRNQIHEKIANSLEELYPERLEEFYEMLAYHYSKSANSEKAYRFLKLSGNKATKNYSNWEAFRFFKEAIKVLTKMPENEENKREQMEVLLLMAGPMFLSGLPENSLEILQTGETISKDLGDEKGLALFLSLIGQYYAFKGGDLFQAIRYSENSFREAERINDIDLMAPVGADLIYLYFWMGEYVKVNDVASKVIPLLEKTQKQAEFFGRPYNVYSSILATQSTCTWRMGNFEEGKALYEKGHDFALKIKDLVSLSLLELHHGWEFSWKGDTKAAIEHLQNTIRYSEEGQIAMFVHVAWLGFGWVYWLMGELETARKYMEKGLKIQIDAGVPYDLGMFYAMSGMVDLDCGDLKKAQHRAEEAVKISGLAWILLGRTLGKADPPQTYKAEQCILKSIKIYEELKIKTYTVLGYFFLGELYADTGQKDKALETLKTAEKMFEDMGMDIWLAKTLEIQEKL